MVLATYAEGRSFNSILGSSGQIAQQVRASGLTNPKVVGSSPTLPSNLVVFVVVDLAEETSHELRDHSRADEHGPHSKADANAFNEGCFEGEAQHAVDRITRENTNE